MGISVVTGQGLDLLTARLTEWAAEQAGGEPALATRERHVSCLRRGVESLDRALASVAGEQLELAAEDLRLAVRALDALIGRIDVEHVLDSVFATFCIGK
jgi:tRNA modification GTPase